MKKRKLLLDTFNKELTPMLWNSIRNVIRAKIVMYCSEKLTKIVYPVITEQIERFT